MPIVIMSRFDPQIIAFVVIVICLTGSSGSSNSRDEHPKIRCKEAERQALLRIKDDLVELEEGLLSSWGKEEEKTECCDWIGIRCDNRTGHIISLDLSPSTFDGSDDYYQGCLEGNISSSLVNLEYLNYLDLSFVNFNYKSFPSSIGALRNLRHLNLSSTFLSGEVPPQLGNLSHLQFLDLNDNYYLEIQTLEWASGLSSLQLLDLSSLNMSSAHDWLQVVNSLPRLTTLLLGDCNLPDSVTAHLPLANSSKALSILDLSLNSDVSASILQWLLSNNNRSLVHLDLSVCNVNTSILESLRNMAALKYLDLTNNNLEGSVLDSFGNMYTLAYLDIQGNQLKGSIPPSLGNMSALEYLDLSRNTLEGEIPNSIWKICTLRHLRASRNKLAGELQLAGSSSSCAHFPLESLDLSENLLTGSLTNFTLYSSLVELRLGSNQLNGNISKSIGQLSKLEVLDVSTNNIQTVMSTAHFSKLHNLNLLDLSGNPRIVFNIPSGWKPPFQLEYINLRSCHLGPHFPKWLQTQSNFLELDMSYSGISESIPNWFWNLPSYDTHRISLSNNEISGAIYDDKHGDTKTNYIDIDLSSNQLEGPIPTFLFHMAFSLNLSRNQFTELNSLCDLTPSINLVFLDISSNKLVGELPDCWSKTMHLSVLILSNNKLTGKIPSSIGFLSWSRSLHLNDNNLTGELPSSLKMLTRLEIFDVGENNLSGPVPVWIGKGLEHLVVLSLRSNNFYGSIPSQLCQLQKLKVLDFSSNSLSSNIPTCLGNITAMKEIGKTYPTMGNPIWMMTPLRRESKSHYDKQNLTWKGAEEEFKSLWILKNIDLSSNKLVGEIPSEITELIGLNSLNLSRNNLSGHIPKEIGQLKSLDALDLSRNQLFGHIPPSLADIDRLNTLDLSNNNLSGKIPTGTQLQTREAASFMDNPELCGDPLPKNCTDDQEDTTPHGKPNNAPNDQEKQDDFVTKGFYISAAIGFVLGFWGFCGSLIFNKSWRYRYLKFLDNSGDWLYVAVAVHKSKLLRIFRR